MCVFNLDLNTVGEQLLVTSVAREFQTVGALQWKARSAKRVLVVGLYSSSTADERRWRADPRSLMWRLRYDWGCQVGQLLIVLSVLLFVHKSLSTKVCPERHLPYGVCSLYGRWSGEAVLSTVWITNANSWPHLVGLFGFIIIVSYIDQISIKCSIVTRTWLF